MRLTLAALVITIIVATVGESRGENQEWFENEYSNCSGLVPIASAMATIAPSSLVVHTGGGVGKHYITIPVATYGAFRKGAILEKEIDTKVLSKDEAASFRQVLLSQADSGSVPMWLASGADIMLGYALPGGWGTGGGLLFSYFVDSINAISVSLKEASRFVAEGGQIYRKITLKKRADGRYFLLQTSSYKVQVGKESRVFSFYACLYPTRVVATEFRTMAGKGMNDKIVKPGVGNKWKVWDVDDNKWDNYEFTYISQDADFFNFEKPDHSKQRISIIGGPWQFKRPNEDSYGTYYNPTSAE